MKRAAFLLIFAFVSLTRAIGQEDEEEPSSNTNPDAGGVLIQPTKGTIAPGAEITITFPNAMVPADRTERSNTAVRERSENRGDISLEKSDRRRVYSEGSRARREPSIDAGPNSKTRPATDQCAGLERGTRRAEFSITTDLEKRERLSAQPQISLESTYKVKRPKSRSMFIFRIAIRRHDFRSR